MATYLFVCPECGQRLTITGQQSTPPGCGCGAVMRRDWKGEGANVAISNLKQAREAGK